MIFSGNERPARPLPATRARRFPLIAAWFALAAGAAAAVDRVPCGGDFDAFVNGLRSEAAAAGYARSEINAFFADVTRDPDVIRRDRSQGIFRKSFIEFSTLVMSEHRINAAADFERRHRDIFDRAEREYGVPRGVLLSFLALETDFGQVQGEHNTLNSLITLAHDCRRPELFRPHVLAALDLFKRGSFDPETTVGAWAGETGMIQMMPMDILNYGRDGDGDGQIDLRKSVADSLMTAGQALRDLGWRPNQPWLAEVIVPQNLNWADTGLESEKTVAEWLRLGVQPRGGAQPAGQIKASILLPHGRHGPAFFALPNFRIYFKWNQSSVYAATSAFFAARLSGAPLYLTGDPEPPLNGDEVLELQRRLERRGHDVGSIDGIVGKRTRAAVKAEQLRLGLPADEWPTRELLSSLGG